MDGCTPLSLHADEITELLMQPHLDGCVLHLCYNSKSHCTSSCNRIVSKCVVGEIVY